MKEPTVLLGDDYDSWRRFAFSTQQKVPELRGYCKNAAIIRQSL
jgi:hypothetical protein